MCTEPGIMTGTVPVMYRAVVFGAVYRVVYRAGVDAGRVVIEDTRVGRS